MARQAPNARIIAAFFEKSVSLSPVLGGWGGIFPGEPDPTDDLRHREGTPYWPGPLELDDERVLTATIQPSQAADAAALFQKHGARSVYSWIAPGKARDTSTIEESFCGGGRQLSTKLGQLEGSIEAARSYLADSAHQGQPVSPTAHWIVDNAYMVPLHARDLWRGLGPTLRKQKCDWEQLAVLAGRFMELHCAALSPALIAGFLADHQAAHGELSSAQLWSFPSVLRVALLIQVVDIADRCCQAQRLREIAGIWADRALWVKRTHATTFDAWATKLRAAPVAANAGFLTALSEQLMDENQVLLALSGETMERLEEIVRCEHQRESSDAALAANAFTSLRSLTSMDYRDVFEQVSYSEQVLRRDPAGTYRRSDFTTRDRARLTVAHVAELTGQEESSVAQLALALASAPGSPDASLLRFLVGDGLQQLERAAGYRPTMQQQILRSLRRRGPAVYAGSVVTLTLALCVVAWVLARDAGIDRTPLLVALVLLASLPLSELAIQVWHALVISAFRPEPLPKLDFNEELPQEHATLVVVPMMLTSEAGVAAEVEKLEVRYLGNPQANLFFALFSDFVDAAERTVPADAALIAIAKTRIESLNQKHGPRFLWFHRQREWSHTQNCWMGRERKRGKIEELNSFLLEGSGDILQTGHLPCQIHFVITLDADTQLPPGAAARLVETIAHPLNRVSIDPATGIRKNGYALIQPRVSIALPGATATRFTRIFADAMGTDPYCSAVSDAQQDLLGEGIFHGKAIYDLQAFHRILDGRFPRETILSHDLIEGAHVGVGLASDIELLENLPRNYATFAQRQHRWTRGDWQIAAWAGGVVHNRAGDRLINPLSFINRWRIFDNLRRSLVPIASFLLLVLGWLFSVDPQVWSLLLAVAVAIPALVPMLDRWSRHLEGTVYGWQGAADDLKRAIVMLAFLPHQAWLSADGIIRACYRMIVSRRRLLEWKTADEAEQGPDAERTQRQLFAIALAAILGIGVLAWVGSLGPSAAFLGLWIASPWIARWLDRPSDHPGRRAITSVESQQLRMMARETWRYFDDLVNEQTQWLPPDNSQRALRVEVAMRTSPSNIGLWLNAALAAHDFGYLTLDDFAQRCAATLSTVGKLERYEGHLLNWYELNTLAPLPPRYVSTVDSGNLLAALWVLAQGCREIAAAPLLNQAAFAGLMDSVRLTRKCCGADVSLSLVLDGLEQTLGRPHSAFQQIGQLRLAAQHAVPLHEGQGWRLAPGDEMSYWADKLAGDLGAWSRFVDRYLAWMEILSRASEDVVRSLDPEAAVLRKRLLERVPSLTELAGPTPEALELLLSHLGSPQLPPVAAQWLGALAGRHADAQSAARETLSLLHEVSHQAQRLADEIDMRFLFDEKRRLFGIGYTVGDPMTFQSHYDLLASECRLSSLVATAKHDVPLGHWFTLGRPRVSTPARRALLSWSGTMFEYLMPLLYTGAFDNSLLEQACGDAVTIQRSFATKLGLPAWGISESAYSALDANQTYQYRAFGVPGLALNPNADPGPVLAPYATMLALMVDPGAAIDNLRALEGEGMRGPMGFYEALDFSRSRKAEDKPGVPIYTYMAHHQGMSLLALNNVLHGNAMQRRFQADPRVRAHESLLFERVPLLRQEPEEHLAPVATAAFQGATRDRGWTQPTSIPHVHLSSNGRYSLMLTNNGAGYSRWKEFDITRWRPDTALDNWGTCVWLHERAANLTWSPTHHPFGVAQGSAQTFSADRATFTRTVEEIEAKVEVIVSSGDAEVRRLTVSNRSRQRRAVELTWYAELAMAPHGADLAHPVFSRMFVETERFDDSTLIAKRRKRSDSDPSLWTAAILLDANGDVQWETDRRAFLGRGRTLRNAANLTGPLSGTAGAVLDPVFCFRTALSLEAREQRVLTFVLMAAESREELLDAIAEYQRPYAVGRAFEMAWTRAQLEFQHLRINSALAGEFEELASHLLYPNSKLRVSALPAGNCVIQPELWRLGISGDLPILLVSLSDSSGLQLIRRIVVAHTYWRTRGLHADVVVLNREPASYEAPLQKELQRIVEPAMAGPRGKIHVVNANSISLDTRAALWGAARAVLDGHRGGLSRQLIQTSITPSREVLTPRRAVIKDVAKPLPPIDVQYSNGFGGFSADGREYVIELAAGRATPEPWINVIANPRGGTMVSEGGLGFTWQGNSQTNRLTPWHNDPVADPQSEILYLRDDDTAQVWTPTPLPCRTPHSFRIRHGQGYSCFEHYSHRLWQRVTVTVADRDPVKLCQVELRNDSDQPRSITATYFVEWVLGSTREQQQSVIVTDYVPGVQGMVAKQNWAGSFAGQVAFLASSPAPDSVTGDRVGFFGTKHDIEHPDGLGYLRLNNQFGSGFDPCGAVQITLTLGPGETRQAVFLLGQAPSVQQAADLVQQYGSVAGFDAALRNTCAAWDRILDTIHVSTPDPAADLLLNRWLLYQALSCRMWARSATYQSGGAIGFRDQLQDAMALLYSKPSLTRDQILRAAAHQFEEGDVQHWWHPEQNLGVRTRCSDDLLWLPWAVARYVDITGDDAALDMRVPFLDAPPLAEGEHERMFEANTSNESGTLREHCIRAIEQGSQFGPHGLPLIGTCDWNDGLSEVGPEGHGESMWLAWFLIDVLQKWIPLVAGTNRSLAATWKGRLQGIAAAAEQAGWDGEWYLRGYFDDGSPLGSAQNEEARIDSLPQSWAVLCGAANPQRAKQAIASARRELVRASEGVVLLFRPPFNISKPHPGYIMGYPPGTRENGGQYTHASLWLAQALARMNDGEGAVDLLRLMNPAERSRTAQAAQRYRGEPYAVAADVSSAPLRVGASGWTWYTGSAGWMYRVWLEDVLGFHLRGNRLTIRPAIPESWPGFSIAYKYGSALYSIQVERTGSGGSVLIEQDGTEVAEIALVDDNEEHHVRISIGTANSSLKERVDLVRH